MTMRASMKSKSAKVLQDLRSPVLKSGFLGDTPDLKRFKAALRRRRLPYLDDGAV